MKSIYIILFSLITIGLYAQPKSKVTYETKLKVADQAAQNHDYYGAIEWYDQAYREKKDINLQIAMADLYAKARNYDRARKIYERVIKRDKNGEFYDLKYDLGRMHKFQGNYQEAAKEFNDVINDAAMDDELKDLARKELAGIKAMDSYNDNLEAVIAFMDGDINSGSAESSPAFGPDGVYFSSFNRRKEIIIDGDQGDYHARIYSAEVNDKGDLSKPRPLNDKINREGFNSGGVSFSRDGRIMYFTRATLNNNDVEVSNIYISRATDRGWSAPEVLTNIPSEAVTKHPYEGELFGTKVLYFTSNMDGGEGGFDIYYAPINGDVYGEPVNLGKSINTSDDEITPYYAGGTLYFSSNGHPNLGGFDIFYSEWNGSSWNVPTNMGFNYNSSYDDMFLRFNALGTQGFLVSNRPDKNKKKLKGNDACCDDIYAVAIKELVIDLLVAVENEQGPLKGATVELYDLTLGSYPDSRTGLDSNEVNMALDADRSYKAIITAEGYFPDSITFNTNGIVDDYTVRETVVLKAKPIDDKSDVEIYTINEPIRLNNIYYDFEKWDILPDAEDDLDVLVDLLNQYPDMKIELSSHTDSRGKPKYNQRLSQKRAESAKNWLVAQGIDPNRIQPVGYGESVILNRCTNGVRCSEEEHQLNRRTEFKITEGPTTIEIKKERLQKKN